MSSFLGINRNTLSFEILEGGNPQTVLFMDTSQYYKIPESPIVEITPPGYTNPFLTNIDFGKINVLNSSTIGISDILETGCLVDLPDGVWKFKYKICPYDQVYVIGYILRTTVLDITLQKVYDAIDFSDCDIAEDENLKKTIVDIMVAIASGKANARAGEAKKADTLYQIANELTVKTLKNLTDRCPCV